MSGIRLFKKLFTVHCSLFTGKTGFTLIETIIVMVIMAILAAVIAVRWSPFDTIKLNNATRKVAADIRYAQKLAISNQLQRDGAGTITSISGITFNVNGYNVYQNIVTSTLAKSSGDPCSTGSSNNFIVAFNEDRCSDYSGVTITTLPTTNPIAFDSLGTPVNSTTGVAIGDQTIIITYNGTKQITVNAGTGRVSY